MTTAVVRGFPVSLVMLLLAAPLARADRGIYPEFDDRIELAPVVRSAAPLHATVDPGHQVVVVWEGGHPRRAYRLDEGVAALAALKVTDVRRLGPGEAVPGGDADDDGIPDALDVLLGAKKVAVNGAAYIEGYVKIPYPGGDVPRDQGVCTDVVIRAVRNAGVDLQKELFEDIGRAPRAYRMVKKRNPHIDHRRVRTILPYFERNWTKLGNDPASQADPFQPGDVVFLDTFPSRSGPDHIGIVSDRRGPSGLYLVVNNWTTGYRESEMDLLSFVPVTARYRISTSPAARGAGRTSR